MKYSLSSFQKLGVGIMSLLVVGTAMYAPLLPNQTPKAHAFIVFDPANFGANFTQTTILQVLNGIAWTVAKMTVQSITRSTVNWINSGFQGSPAFVSDLNANLSNLSDSVAEQFFKELDTTVQLSTGFSIRSPFQDQLSQKLRQEYYRQTSGLLGISQYDLYKYSSDPKAFLGGDFSKGGFDAFFAANKNPANNPFAAWDMANQELAARRDAATKQREAELNWGKGFLSWRGNCTSGNAGAGAAVSLSKAEQCTGNSVKTPGSVIESQLEQSLGTGIRQLELADSINEIVGALMGQLVNQVLGGVGLTGASLPSAGGGQSFINQATSPTQYDSVTASLSDGVMQSIKDQQSTLQAARDGWQTILTAANGAQQACGPQPAIFSAISTAQSGITKIDSSLQNLSTVQSNVQAAVQSTAADKSTQITKAITSYQTFLSSPSTPAASDIAAATQQSTDTTGTATSSPSLYTQMTNLQKSCGRT